MFFSINLIQNKCPQLVPPEVLRAENMQKFKAEFLECLYYFPEIMVHIATQATKEGHVLWCHPNLNLDNAFFYRGEDGKEIKCGGLDFGGYGGHLVTVLLSGSIAGAENDYYVPQHEALIRRFCSEYSAASGEQLDGEEIFRDYSLLSTMKSLICCAVSLKVFETMDEAELRSCRSERDPPMSDDFYGRCFVKMTIGSFERWHDCHAYQTFAQWKTEQGIEDGYIGLISGWIFYWPWGWLHTIFMNLQVMLYNRGLLGAMWGLVFLILVAYLAYHLAIFFLG